METSLSSSSSFHSFYLSLTFASFALSFTPLPLYMPLPLKPFPFPLFIPLPLTPFPFHPLFPFNVLCHVGSISSASLNGVDATNIQPQILRQWTNILLHLPRGQEVIVQWPSSRLLMSILQHNELTQVTLQVVISQTKTNHLIQKIRGFRSFWQ